MPLSSEPLRQLGFLTIGLFEEADPRQGHELTLEIIELGEQLGFDSVWVRHRHLQFGISSPVAILAAASQRTRRIQLGTAVIPLGWENPLRLAEDLATVDVLSGGRFNPGVSVGPPMHYDQVKHALYPDTGDVEDFSYERVRRLLDLVRGEPASDFSGVEGFEVFSDRVQPHAPGLGRRMWYGGASLRSAQWAGEHRMNFLTSSAVKAEESADFAEIQLSHIRTFRTNHPDGARARVSQGLVVIPTDTASPEQRRKYEEFAAGGRRAPPRHRVPRACCSRLTSSGPPRRSPGNSGRMRPFSRSTRWRSPSPSPSTTRITCRSSPISPRSSARLLAGCRVPPRENHGKYLLRGRDPRQKSAAMLVSRQATARSAGITTPSIRRTTRSPSPARASSTPPPRRPGACSA